MNLPETNISNNITFVLNDNDGTSTGSISPRSKQLLLEHIYSGVDVILVTSSQRDKESLFIQQCFSDNSDQIRTILLNSDSFPQDASGQSNATHELSMISAVVYESIHLDTHFAIVVSDADQLPLEILNELIKFAIGINSSKNNVNFIFSGGPDLLGLIQKISDITRLGLVHCSLDEITEDDIQAYIDEKQAESVESKKLKFNKYALKKITTYANGSLYKASILLEWCREYAIHTGNFKVTVGSIDEILKDDKCNQLLTSYPSANFEFGASETINEIINDRSENIEFSEQPQQQKSVAKNKTAKTVYIDESSPVETNVEPKQKNVYEKVMASTNSEVDAEDDNIVIEISSADSELNEINKDSVTEDESSYKDNYHLEAIKNINTPLSPSYDDADPYSQYESSNIEPVQLTTATSNASNSAFLWTFLILAILLGTYYLFSSKVITYDEIRAHIENIIYPNDSSNDAQTTPHEKTNIPIEGVSASIDSNYINQNRVFELLQIAESQISQKKLSTPPSDNALETYKLILEISPNNNQALKGIQLIKKRYQTWAKLDIKDGNSRRAKYFLQRAIEISPDQEAINLLADLQ
ncbi:MAG: hypothetical protein R8G33_10080 [Gammaproteobacteria bacterium]|nr:hypothetical protein [Gammaproteobacteria bacterium]